MKPGKHKTDSPEEIQLCLSCTKAECVNCLKFGRPETERRGRPGRPIVAIKGDEWLVFDTAKDAGEAMGSNAAAVCGAIRRKHRHKGYYWRYLDDE